MFRFEIAMMVLCRANSCTSQPSASATSRTVSSGECSSHSPGCWRGGRSSWRWVEVDAEVVARSPHSAPDGADQMAITVESTISTAAMTIDCQRKMVSVNGITPVIGSSVLGRLAALAWSWAADELRPSAQVAPRPR